MSNARIKSITAYIPKRKGASLQPCLIVLLYSLVSVKCPSVINLACVWFLDNGLNLRGQPNFYKNFRRSSLLSQKLC